MKNICFITNFKKTFFFEAIARELKTKDVNVFWIVLNDKLYKYLLSCGYTEDKLLLINKTYIDKHAEPVGEYKLTELICKDRVLKYYKIWPYNFLKNIQQPLVDFLRKNDIHFVFGEMTYAHEILLYRILKDSKNKLNCPILNPMNVRMPSDRFTFLDDEYQSSIYKNIDNSADTSPRKLSVERPLESFKVEKLVNSALKFSGKYKRFVRFFTMENLEKDDPSLSPSDFRSRLKKGVNEEINRISYFFIKTEKTEILKDKKFVIYTLHKQPEASIDVVGRYYDDQYLNIFNVWRFIPDDWYIVVKEHNNAIGDRGYKFFKKIKKLRNLVLINENENSHQLIEKSQAIFSVSGSIAYEAALMNKPAFVFSNIFFAHIPYCKKITLEDLRATGNIYELIQNMKGGQSLDEFKEFLYKGSFKGLISDPLTNPSCMEDENISLVTKAFESVINS